MIVGDRPWERIWHFFRLILIIIKNGGLFRSFARAFFFASCSGEWGKDLVLRGISCRGGYGVPFQSGQCSFSANLEHFFFTLSGSLNFSVFPSEC